MMAQEDDFAFYSGWNDISLGSFEKWLAIGIIYIDYSQGLFFLLLLHNVLR